MSVTSPHGFRAAGVAAGLKTGGGLDLAVVVNDGPQHAAAGVFTANRVKAAPVVWTEQLLFDGRADAVVLNSGGANACTGPEGFQDTHRTAERTALLLGASAADIAVCSTGLIGERLPMDPLLAGLRYAVAQLSPEGGADAAAAIMTTDTVPKQAVAAGDGWTVGGMAKGAGMLAPALATMLVVLTTDAEVEPERLDKVLRSATEMSFDRIDADGCMSTNDTVLLLASGASGIRPDDEAFAAAVTKVCRDLSQQLIRDAEGATKFISIRVARAATEDDAVIAARAIARSNLVKCAVHGADPNWGRILAAVGTTDAAFDPARLSVEINGIEVCRAGAVGEDRSLVDMSRPDVHIVVDLGEGNAEATIWTTDLTAEYVRENSAYSS